MQNTSPHLPGSNKAFVEPIRKKILFTSVAADGHFNPLTGLAKHLQAAGYDVRWYSSKTYQQKLEALDIPYYLYDKALELPEAGIDEVFPERAKIKGKIKKLNFDFIHFFIKMGPLFYEDICAIRQQFPFDLVITDVAFTGIPFITDKLNIPVIAAGVFPLSEKSKDLAPSGLGLVPATSLAGRIKQQVLHFISDKFLFRAANKALQQVLSQHDIEPKGQGLFDMLTKKSTLLLQIGSPGFEYLRSDLGKNIRFIGALLPYRKPGIKAAWYDERLARYKKIILVTQGTVERDPEKIIIPTLEAFKNSSTLVIVTTGGAYTQQLRHRFPQPNIVIEDFIPFADVMPHVDVYISNGGYGGVMLAIEHRLPMVVAGMHEGKNEINARIGYFQLGINLQTETPSPDQLYNAVKEVFNNPVYKQSVEKLGHELKEYDSFALCTAYINEVLTAYSASGLKQFLLDEQN